MVLYSPPSLDPEFGIEEATLSVLKNEDDVLGVSGGIFKSVFLVPMTGKTTEPCYMFSQR
jgi:hypothetical protein